MDMHCLLALGSLLVLTLACSHNVAMSHSDYPGVIELVGYSNRRARTYYKPSQEQLPPASAKIQADIETVKQNIEKYNKLLTLDTKNLPESQKDMLERIVERVARLKESLDINEKLTQVLNKTQPMIATKSLEDNENSTANPADTSSALLDEDQDKTEPTLILDVTTLQQLQTSMDKLEAVQGAVSSYTSQQLREGPTTTELNYETESDQESTEAEQEDEYNVFDSTTLEPLTDTTANDEQFVAARANNNLAITAAAEDADTVPTFSTTLGSQRTLTTSSGTKMTKTRATKRPGHSSTKNSHTISSNKRKPVTSSSASLSSASAAYAKASNKHNNKLSSTTVTQPISSSMQHQQQQQQQQQHYQHRITQKPLPPIYQSQPPKAISSSPLATDKYSTSSSSATSATNGLTVDNNAVIGSSSTSATTYPDTNLPATPVLGTGYSSANSQNFVYDNHVNTSAIIYSLNNAREEFYHQKQTNLANLGASNKDEKPAVGGGKPTKYHYYPHNQHIYMLPECAIQQVCNAVYVRLNYTQPLCACPSRYRDPCSASLNEDDQHTTKLVGDIKKKAITLAKTCEATTEMRECRTPKDWSLLALQNTRTGKSHYLVICRCPDHFKLDGPMAHDQNTYASVPGIRVFGMMCVKPGYSIRKPSAQPPKRYQLQKPFYRPGSQTSSNLYGSNKDVFNRPSYGGISSSLGSHYHSIDNYGIQTPQQGSYQYLNRPESTINTNYPSQYQSRPDPVSINNFPGGSYGRNREREGNLPIEAATELDENKILISTSTQANNEESRTTVIDQDNIPIEDLERREKRSIIEEIEGDISWDDMPEFPWERVKEFEKNIVWG